MPRKPERIQWVATCDLSLAQVGLILHRGWSVGRLMMDPLGTHLVSTRPPAQPRHHCSCFLPTSARQSSALAQPMCRFQLCSPRLAVAPIALMVRSNNKYWKPSRDCRTHQPLQPRSLRFIRHLARRPRFCFCTGESLENRRRKPRLLCYSSPRQYFVRFLEQTRPGFPRSAAKVPKIFHPPKNRPVARIGA